MNPHKIVSPFPPSFRPPDSMNVGCTAKTGQEMQEIAPRHMRDLDFERDSSILDLGLEYPR